MPDSDRAKKMKEQWPRLPTIRFNSVEEVLTGPGQPSADTVNSITGALDAVVLPSHKPGKCCGCGGTAQFICKGCKGSPADREDKMIITHYCSAACAKAHWKSHKKDCKAAADRRLLYRSAGVSKALFYVHQKMSFTWGYFENIDRHGQYRVVFLNQAKSNARKTMLVPFSTVTDLVSDQGEQEAFLTHLSCREAIAKFGPLLAGTLRGTSCR